MEKYALIYAGVCLLVLSFDLLTKHLAEIFIKEEVELLPFLKLVLVYNRGVAFGVFSDAPDWLRIPLLIGVPPIAVAFTFFYSLKKKEVFTSFVMGLVGGGALGNLYDRWMLGQVRDFIYFSYGKFSYPAFNVADAMISLAIALFVLREVFKK